MARRSLLSIVTIVLAVTTAMALLVLALTLFPLPAPPVADLPASAPADEEVVARFYAGLNQVLATGDVALLDTTLAADVAVQLPGQPAGDRADLLAWLAAVRDAAPGARIILSDVIVGRGRSAAQATAVGGAPRIAGALVLDAPAAWDASAFLRLHDGRVAAYAPVAAPAALSAAWPSFRLPLAADPQSLLLARVRLPGDHSRAEIILPSWQALLAETGTAQVDIAGPVQRAVAGAAWADVPQAARPIVLQPGEALLIPPHEPLALRPADAGPVVLLQLGLAPVARDPAQRAWMNQSVANRVASAQGHLALTAGATLEPVTTGALPVGKGPSAQAMATLTRAALPPGAALAPHPLAGGQWVVVEAGLLGVAVAAIGPDAPEPTGEVLIRDGFPVAAGIAPQMRNAGGTRLELVVVTVEPVG